jgi:hypothetical protein
MHDPMFAKAVFVMTVKAEDGGLGLQQFSMLSCMRIMAGAAITITCRHMAAFLSDKQIGVMTGETELRRVREQQLRDVTAVRIVARGAFPGSCWRV